MTMKMCPWESGRPGPEAKIAVSRCAETTLLLGDSYSLENPRLVETDVKDSCKKATVGKNLLRAGQFIEIWSAPTFDSAVSMNPLLNSTGNRTGAHAAKGNSERSSDLNCFR